MRFWDSSALLPLLIREPTSKRLEDLLRLDTDIALWWGTPMECASALRGAAALEGFLVMPYSEEVHEEEFED